MSSDEYGVFAVLGYVPPELRSQLTVSLSPSLVSGLPAPPTVLLHSAETFPCVNPPFATPFSASFGAVLSIVNVYFVLFPARSEMTSR